MLARGGDHPTLNGADEKKLNIVGKFLEESEEVKNKEGFIKIYRHPFLQKTRAANPRTVKEFKDKPERSDPTDALVDLIVRETTRRPDHKRSGNGNYTLNAKAAPFSPSPSPSPSQSSTNSTPTCSPGGSRDVGFGSSGRSGLSSQIDSSKNVVLLFDLNGTLINKTDARR